MLIFILVFSKFWIDIFYDLFESIKIDLIWFWNWFIFNEEKESELFLKEYNFWINCISIKWKRKRGFKNGYSKRRKDEIKFCLFLLSLELNKYWKEELSNKFLALCVNGYILTNICLEIILSTINLNGA